MILFKPEWRVLTVGDGDLSFSRALTTMLEPSSLCATVLDSKEALDAKYQHHEASHLSRLGVNIHFGVDICDSASFVDRIAPDYDAVVFQFPLVVATSDIEAHQQSQAVGGSNIRNRILLRSFLLNSFRHILAPSGPRLCFITSKDVKPYSHWGLEGGLIHGTDVKFLGRVPFNTTAYPEYRVRNVERDKFVKDTASYTYVYSDTAPRESDINHLPLTVPKHCLPSHCPLCGVGPFLDNHSMHEHEKSKRHLKMAEYDLLWKRYLENRRSRDE